MINSIKILSGVLFLACLTANFVLMIGMVHFCIENCQPRIECSKKTKSGEVIGWDQNGLYEYKEICIQQQFKLTTTEK